MSEGLFWGIVFALSALGGVGGLLLLHQSSMRDAIAKVQSEAAAAAAQFAEVMRTLDAANATRRALEDEMRAKDDLLQRTESELQPLRANMDGLRTRLAAMEATWLDPEKTEPDCHKLLEKNLWVLYPDYVVDPHFLSNRGVTQAFANHFGRDRQNWIGGKDALDREAWRIRVPSGARPDLFGNARASGGLGNDDDVYLIIELKEPGLSIGWDHIEQVHAYALSLMMNVGSDLRNKRIDCLVIGKCVGEDVNDAHLRWGKEAHHAIRIVPMSYRQLYNRACKIAEPFISGTFADGEVAIPHIDQVAVDELRVSEVA